jgi:hypothetical protein
LIRFASKAKPTKDAPMRLTRFQFRRRLFGRIAWLIAALASPLATCRGGEQAGPSAPENFFDLSRAVVLIPCTATPPEMKAARMLVEEVEARSMIRWAITDVPPRAEETIIALGQAAALKPLLENRAAELGNNEGAQAREGFRIRLANDRTLLVAGNDARGVLFGAGRLLRELHMTRGSVLLARGLRITTAPKYPLRGHQLGYRPKTNSYDAWDLAQWERYIRDLAVFGTNAVELIPPRSDDDADSPHFPLPPMEMLVGMSRLLDAYGLDVWLWYPAMDKDYSDPRTVEFALKEWGDIFEKLPRVDAVFVPGGDPGHTQPKYLLPLLEKQKRVLGRSHPNATLWVSPQGFTKAWLDEFLQLIREQQPSWLDGIVYGPQTRISLPDLRAAVPARYPIRWYPDITHSLQCQYPVPDWDLAFALTEEREVINPRPLGQTAIFRNYHKDTIGFLTYSEGCNDDVNKFIWSGLGWDPDADVMDILRQYSRYFIGTRYTDTFAQGLAALERNWQGPLLTNGGVDVTLRQFQELERAANPRDLRNWRFQQALYRAYHDAYVRDRLINETQLETEALSVLRRAPARGSTLAIDQAVELLDRSVTRPTSLDRRARAGELAEALFQSIQMQLSVPKYAAISEDRGATLDKIDLPLNNRVWLKQELAKARALGSEVDRLKAIEAILNRTDPGPGGFYDDLGDPIRQPHLVRGPGFARDPAFLRSSIVGFGNRPDWPLAWCHNAQTLYDEPLRMHYEGLDPQARYRIRVVYSGDTFRIRLSLKADELEVHPWLDKPDPVKPLEFDVPPAATSDGSVTFSWTVTPGRGGNGRGCQVAEVWLIRSGATGETTKRETSPAR